MRVALRSQLDGASSASLVASDAAIEAALGPVKLFQGICKRGCDVDSRLLSKPSAWISWAPVAAFRSERLGLRAVWARLWGLFLSAASFPAAAGPRSRPHHGRWPGNTPAPGQIGAELLFDSRSSDRPNPVGEVRAGWAKHSSPKFHYRTAPHSRVQKVSAS